MLHNVDYAFVQSNQTCLSFHAAPSHIMVDNWPSGAYKWNLCNGICLLPRLEAGKNLTWADLCADQVTESQLRVVTVTVLSGPKRPWNIWTQPFLISVFLPSSLLPQTQDWRQSRWIKSGIAQERRALESLWECVQGRSMGGRKVHGTRYKISP